jgi:hypothetical protein
MPEDTGLTGAIAQAERNKPKKIRLPRPAGDPMLERTIATLRKYYDRQIESANINPMPWYESAQEPNILGTTTPSTDPNDQVYINRRLLMFGPEMANLRTLAHELTHVGQNENLRNQFTNPDLLKLREELEFALPYGRRPGEISAATVGSNLEELLSKRRFARPEATIEDVNQYHFGPSNAESIEEKGFPFDFRAWLANRLRVK